MSSDPSQSAAQAAGRQDRALQEKHRAKLQEGALTGFEERNTKWDVEYEGKDAVGGAHDMLDRCGPNVLSGPIPRDGMTTDIYEDRSRDRLHQMGWSDIMGETGERPDEISNGIDHLDKLEHLGKSAKDLQYTAGFTGNEGLYNAKLNVMQ